MIKKKTFTVLLFLVFCINNSFSQNFWNNQHKKSTLIQQNEILDRKNTPQKYTLASLDFNGFKNHLTTYKSRRGKNIINLPNSKGKLQRFSIKETSCLAPELASKFPMIKTYSAQGIDDPNAIAKITLGANGLHALIYTANKSAIYIDPYTIDKKQYIIYQKKDLKTISNDFTCQIEETFKQRKTSNPQQKTTNDGKLRTYRIAIACTNEYSKFHLKRQNIPDSATDDIKKAVVLSAINTTMARVNQIYERDLAVRMILVNDNDKIIFLESNGDDGLTNNNDKALIDESQVKCDDVIGDENYDIGHTFSTGRSGLAQPNSVCVTGYKAQGITGNNDPINDSYDVDYVAHELGHQFGATHTQNNDCNRWSSTSVEPGSGSTIMGYAGICSPNIQQNSNSYFHAVSIAQMWSHIQNGGSCGVQSNTNNNAPTANAGSDVSIPKGTPFILRGTATDAQGIANLTYNWEQIDTETATMPPLATNTQGPTFRSLPSKTSSDRYLPAFQNVINGSSTEWEVIPTVPRELNFALTVRDNHPQGGNTARDDIKITLTDSQPFIVTSPTTEVRWDTGSSQTITWNKGTTNKAPINCMKVNIKLSIDGGLTFPIILKENTLNDGQEDILIPYNPTTKARILIEAVDNIFYNVNNTNFTIDSTTPTFLVSNKTNEQIVCNTKNSVINYTLNFNFINGFSETVNLSATGLPNGTTATFNPKTINANGNVVMTINNLNGNNQQDNTIIIQGKSATVTQTTKAFLKITGTDFVKVNLITPANNENEISINKKFEWEADSNATAYDIIVATDANFTDIIINKTVTTNSYKYNTSSLLKNTNYFWRVKPKNNCGEGNYSNVNKFTTELPTYCTSTYTEEIGGAEYISNVTFNTINNNSLNDHIDGYQDFTDISTNIKRTQEYEINVTFNTSSFQDHCYVFIDWNHDYIFDKTTERYDLGAKKSNIAIGNLKITVPKNAVLGKTRMRVIIEYYTAGAPNGDGACDTDHNSEFGETEDYSVNIEEKPLSDFSITNTTDNLSICNSTATEQVFEIDYKALFGFNENVLFSVSGIPVNSISKFNQTSINTNGLIKLTLAELNKANVGKYNIIVTATANSIVKSIEIPFNINDNICESSGNTTSQISITNVNFGEIDNSSTKTTGYSDFKTMATEVVKGESYPLKTTINTDGNNSVKTYAWIDWNQNCLFDEQEKYDLTTNNNLITVPENALIGSTILRISTKLNEFPKSCELDFNGEVEDYTINITPSFKLTNNSQTQSICNKAVNEAVYKIDFKSLNGFDIFNKNVILSTENLPKNATITFNPTVINTEGIFTATISNLSKVNNGDYTIKITASTTSITKSVNLRLIVNDNHCKSSGNTTSQISITNVNFGEIDNSSTKTTGYSDFKTIATEVVKGEKYPLKATINTDGNNSVKTYAWIDWNQNCLFDEQEKYNLTRNNSITIPSDALTGSTILRISTKLNEFPKSCEVGFNGEVEDYTINITPGFTLTNNTETQSICNKAVNEVTYEIDYKPFNDFNTDSSGGFDGFNENIILSAENLPENTTITFNPTVINAKGIFTATISNLNKVNIGDYIIKIIGSTTSTTASVNLELIVNDNHCKSSGNTTSQISITNVNFGEIDNSSTKTIGYSDFKTVATEVVKGENYTLNTSVNTDGNNNVKTYAWIDWNQNCLFDEQEKYDLTTNNNLITVPENALIGSTTLRISTKLNEFPKSCEVNFNGEVEDYTINIEEPFASYNSLFSDLKIYPVPSNGKLTVSFNVKVKDLIIIRLFNITGQLLNIQNFSTISSKFNNEIEFSEISSGIYFIQIENDGKINTRKIIIK